MMAPPPTRFSELTNTGGVAGAPTPGGHFNIGLSGERFWVPDLTPEERHAGVVERAQQDIYNAPTVQARRAAVANYTAIQNQGIVAKQRAAELAIKRDEVSRKISHDEAQLKLDAVLKAAEAARANAGANLENLRSAATVAEAARPGATPESVGAVAHGRPLPAERYTGFPTMTGNEIMTLNARTGKVELQTATKAPSEETIAADMKAQNMTRAQVLKKYEELGKDVSKFR
jgi:hypothetical protein